MRPAAHRFGPAQVLRRRAGARLPLRPGRTSQARRRCPFVAHEARTAAGLARSQNHPGLVAVGLLRWACEGPRRVFRLPRWG